MANKTEIHFNIGPDGEVTLEVKGVAGPDCLELTKEIEAELGQVTEQEKTADYYDTSVSETESVKVEGD